MTWYSELPSRRARQILGDAWLVAWIALWVWVGFRLHDLIMNLAAPGLAITLGHVISLPLLVVIKRHHHN